MTHKDFIDTPKRYAFAGTLNTRDLAGYPTRDGLYTKFHQFIRSDMPRNLSENDIKFLQNINIKNIIDLRSEDAARRSPNSLLNNENFTCFNFPLAVNSISIQSADDLILSYLKMADNFESMTKIMKVFATCSGGVLFHCQEGKDRTGVLSAILLALADVYTDDIIADYQLSGVYFRKFAKIILEHRKDTPEYLINTKAEYIEAFLEAFNNKYESAENYVKLLGLSDEEIQNIKHKLIE